MKKFEAAEKAQAKKDNPEGEKAMADELAAFADDMAAFDGLDDYGAETKPASKPAEKPKEEAKATTAADDDDAGMDALADDLAAFADDMDAFDGQDDPEQQELIRKKVE